MRTVLTFGKTFVLAFVVLDIIQTIYRHYKKS